MNFQIKQNKLTDEVKKKIFQRFAHRAIKATGMNGLNEDPISFEILDKEKAAGVKPATVGLS